MSGSRTGAGLRELAAPGSLPDGGDDLFLGGQGRDPSVLEPVGTAREADRWRGVLVDIDAVDTDCGRAGEAIRLRLLLGLHATDIDPGINSLVLNSLLEQLERALVRGAVVEVQELDLDRSLQHSCAGR